MNLRRSIEQKVFFPYDSSFIPPMGDEVMKGCLSKYGQQHSYYFDNQHVEEVMTHAFTPSRSRWISAFEGSLVYRVSSRMARATQRTMSQKSKIKQADKKPACIKHI